MAQISLDRKKCDEFLVSYLETGYKNSKVFTIKDGSVIAKYCRLISEDEKDDSITKQNLYNTVFQILEAMNKSGAFSLGDATLLERIRTMIDKDFVEKVKEEKEPKIKEI